VVTGPRQSGKTTLVQQVFPEKKYVSLENPDEREFADQDPKRFLSRFPRGAILDEVQRCPEILAYLQSRVDADRQPGQFILTGSQQFGLMSGITQSLAAVVPVCSNFFLFPSMKYRTRTALRPLPTSSCSKGCIHPCTTGN
jgi:hypothetical protein